jgi:ABC-type nitrate/sulfonate/bicarbonate transport system ATPase subunit
MSPRGSHLNLKAINHRYRFRAPLVLEDVSLTIEPGQRVALIGRSSCGKSTLLQLMSGLVRPTSAASTSTEPRRGDLRQNGTSCFKSRLYIRG